MPRAWNYSVIIPTLNAERHWLRFAPALLACASAERVLIVDSESTDRTAELARQEGMRLLSRPQREFNHGGTRQWSMQFTGDAEILVFLTQDAILASSDALEKLLDGFEDPKTGAAFGRQMARPGAGAIETHGRLFNYPAVSSVRSLDSRETMGFKSIFLSNSFAAYRRTALDAVGGFPTNVIFGEDTVTAAHLLLNGWNIHYVADAEAYHSHDYSWWQEFQRYFDIGVLHSQESWLREEFGKTGKEGTRFLLSELTYLRRADAASIPSALMRTAAKLAGYRLGGLEGMLPVPLKSRLSMHKDFWKD
jgi:rhamnosyltransferase